MKLKYCKWINLLLLVYGTLWFFQYFLSFVHGAHSIYIFLILPILILSLFVTVVIQLIKTIKENYVKKERLVYISLILCLLFFTIFFPNGIVNWEKYEDSVILEAHREGTANCRVVLKLKSQNVFTYTSICFGKDIYSGTYHIKNDTIFLNLNRDLPYLKKTSYGVFIKQDSTKNFNQICIYESMNATRCIELFIK
jgi:flagellar biosynthesis protein FliQ